MMIILAIFTVSEVVELKANIEQYVKVTDSLRWQLLGMLKDGLDTSKLDEVRQLSDELRVKDSLLKLYLEEYIKVDTGCEQFLKLLVNRYPNNPWVKLKLGTVYESMGQLEQALTYYRYVIRDYGRLVDAHIGYARVMEQLGNNREALAAYKRALSLAPKDSTLYQAIIRLTPWWTKKKLIREWEIKLKFDPNNEVLKKYLEILKKGG